MSCIPVDLAGQKFGRLTALERVVRRGKTYWRCSCDCGNETTVLLGNLRRGRTQSCGCLNAELSSKRMRGHNHYRKLPPGEAGFRRLVRNYKRQAADRDFEWGLTDKQVRRLTQANCWYCGAPPSQCSGGHNRKSDIAYIYNGIDRVDSTKGYVPENTVSCCYQCNRAKANSTLRDFLQWVEQVHNFQKGGTDAK